MASGIEPREKLIGMYILFSLIILFFGLSIAVLLWLGSGTKPVGATEWVMINDEYDLRGVAVGTLIITLVIAFTPLVSFLLHIRKK